MTYKTLKTKSIWSLNDGRECGKIIAIYIDKETKEIVYLECESGLFAPSDVNGIGDVVTLLNTPYSLTVDLTRYLRLKADAKIYDCKGRLLSEDYDYPLSTSYKNQRVLTVADDTYDLDKIVSASDAIFVNTGRQLPQKRTAKEPSTTKPTSKPKSSCLDYAFLMGRVTTRKIVDINGNVVLKEGVIITPSVVEDVKARGKLAELVAISKK